MKTLVTGGSGFIGGYFHRELTARGHQIVNLDLVPPTGTVAESAFVQGDVRDPKAVEKAIHALGEPVERVVHLAAAHHDFGIDHDTYYDVNENGARVLTDAMDAAGVAEPPSTRRSRSMATPPNPSPRTAPRSSSTPTAAASGRASRSSWRGPTRARTTMASSAAA